MSRRRRREDPLEDCNEAVRLAIGKLAGWDVGTHTKAVIEWDAHKARSGR